MFRCFPKWQHKMIGSVPSCSIRDSFIILLGALYLDTNPKTYLGTQFYGQDPLKTGMRNMELLCRVRSLRAVGPKGVGTE